MRDPLERMAYRMLGSVADAEDVVAEARLRLLEANVEPDNPDAWLVRVVTRLAIDRLRQLKRERSSYPGPWLPEPVATDDDGESLTELADELSTALLLMMERLTPSERAVFVLREALELSYAEIAAALELSPENARQRMRRARQSIVGAKRYDAPPQQQRQALNALMAVVASGDVARIAALLAPDAVAFTDGGGVVSAAIVPVRGAERIATVAAHLFRQLVADGDFALDEVAVGGQPALRICQNGQVHSLFGLTLDSEGAVRHLYVFRNPHKLAAFQP